MGTKFKTSAILIIFLFFSGSLAVFIGLSKGHDMAIGMSRPIGATSWSTSTGMVAGCTYTPVIIGTSLIILSIILSAVVFINWFNK